MLTPCQVLNLYRPNGPARPSGAPYPILLWIFGELLPLVLLVLLLPRCS